MNAKHLLAALMVAVTGLVPMSPTQAQDAFPSKPIRIVVPFAAGSGADDNSRFYAELMQRQLKVPVVVENRPGSGGEIGAAYVKNQPADGYTVLLGSNSILSLAPVLKKNLPYDAFADFRPVHGIQVGGAMLVVPVQSTARTVSDLLKLAKTENRPLSMGNYSEGYQLLATWLGHAGQVPITHVPYKGGGQMMTDVIGGRLDGAFIDAAGVQEMVRAGKVRGLAITDGTRDTHFPDLPTMKEAGLADFESYVWTSFYVHAKTPDAATHKLADAVRDALKTPESKARMASRPGREMSLYTRAMGDFQRAESERFKKVINAAGL